MIKKILYSIITNAFAIWIAYKLVQGFNINGNFVTLLYIALIFTLLNYIVKPILKFIASPIIFITFGLGIIVINAIIIYLLTIVLPSVVTISGLYPLIYATFVIGITNAFLHLFLKSK